MASAAGHIETADDRDGRVTRAYSYVSRPFASLTDGGGFAGWDAAAASSSQIAYDAVGNLTTFDAEPYRLGSITYDGTDPCADQ